MGDKDEASDQNGPAKALPMPDSREARDHREREEDQRRRDQDTREREQDQRDRDQDTRERDQDARHAEQEERDRLREMFIGVLSHDLRNPLGAITLGAATLLKGGTLGEKEFKAVARIARSADRMMRMIHQLLDFTRSRLGGGMPIERSTCDLNELARHVVEEVETGHPDRTFQIQETANAKGMWDRDRVSQLLSNLIGNAVQHGRAGTPIRVSLYDDAEQIEIAVENQGTAIPSSLIPVLFDPFRHGQRRSDGIGLGLYIAQQIALAHRGDITVRSSSDGTCFRVRLPR